MNKLKKNGVFFKLKRDYQLYLMALPAAVLFFIFSYLPMFGLVLAFKKYDYKLGIWGSNWADPWYSNFEIVFNNSSARNALQNTLIMNCLFIVFGTVAALTLALAFNEIVHTRFKKVTQSITFLPHFISPVVVGIFVAGMLNYENGSINSVLVSLGFEKVAFFTKAELWPAIMVIVNIWKGAGYSAIVYMAAMSGIDPSYYEAADIDGASRGRKMWSITLPLIRPTVVILTIMAVGKIMNSDFGMFFNVTGDSSLLYDTMDVLDTYIYRCLRQLGDIGISSATSFFQSVTGLILVLVSNKLANKVEEGSGLF